MRKITEMVVVTFSPSGSIHDYKRGCNRLVTEGFTPYGKPYTSGSVLFREFVKYEYIPPAEPEEWEEDVMEEQVVPEDPWETHDFFEDIDD